MNASEQTLWLFVTIIKQSHKASSMQRYQGPVFCQRKVDKKTKHLIDQYFALWSNWIAIANNTTKVRYECFCFTVVVRILRWFISTCYITRRFISLPTCKCTCKYGKKNDLACLYWVSRVAMKTWTWSVVTTPFYSQQMLINGIQPNLWPTFRGSVSHCGIYSCVWSRTCSTQSQILLVCVYKSFVYMSFPVDICNNGIRWVTLPPC